MINKLNKVNGKGKCRLAKGERVNKRGKDFAHNDGLCPCRSNNATTTIRLDLNIVDAAGFGLSYLLGLVGVSHSEWLYLLLQRMDKMAWLISHCL